MGKDMRATRFAIDGYRQTKDIFVRQSRRYVCILGRRLYTEPKNVIFIQVESKLCLFRCSIQPPEDRRLEPSKHCISSSSFPSWVATSTCWWEGNAHLMLLEHCHIAPQLQDVVAR